MEAGEPRGRFADTAHFETVYTDSKGEATVKFKLPDNVTTYRVTAHSANEDMYVGVDYIDIVSKLDFFVQSVEPRKVKTTDDLVLNATSIADEKYDVEYEFTIKELNKTLTTTGTTNNIATVNFGKLDFGTYHAIIRGKSGEYEDAIEYEFNVVQSAQEVKYKTELNINENAQISVTKNPICLEIYNEKMSQYLKYVGFIERTLTPRLETQIAYNEIIKIKNQYYGTDDKINYIDTGDFIGSSGFKNLPNAKEDLLLTALISYYAKDYYSPHIYGFRDFRYLLSEDVNLFEIYLLAASKNESVLNDLLYLKEENIDNYNKLLLTLSFEFLGDYQNAKELYNSINLNDEEAAEYKSITAIIETFVNKNNAITKINEMIEENPADEYLRFAILSFFKNSSEEISEKQTVKVICGNTNETITLNGMQVKTYTINNEELNNIRFETDSKNLMVSYYYQTLLEDIDDENVSKDIKINIRGELERYNTVLLDIDFYDGKSCDVRIALPNSLRLDIQKNIVNNNMSYYLSNNNIDYIVIHKKQGYSHLEIPLLVVYEGEYKFENVVVKDEGVYHISNSLDLNIK